MGHSIELTFMRFNPSNVALERFFSRGSATPLRCHISTGGICFDVVKRTRNPMSLSSVVWGEQMASSPSVSAPQHHKKQGQIGGDALRS